MTFAEFTEFSKKKSKSKSGMVTRDTQQLVTDIYIFPEVVAKCKFSQLHLVS